MPSLPRPLLLITVAIVTLAAFGAWQTYQVTSLERSVADLKRSLAALDTHLATALHAASTTLAVEVPTPEEAARREVVVAKSQDEQLQEAVAAVTPAVVSIVETKVVPLLKVSYVNPFGNDPFFQGFGVQVPVYQQVGTTTQKAGAGTGFLVRSNGYIVTNKHVVADAGPEATYTVLLANGSQKPATVVWRAPADDLAVVKVAGSGYPTVPLDTGTLALGQSVFAVGNALGEYNNSVSVGIISGLDREISAADASGRIITLQGVIQTDAAINPGNSGGPLVNLAGRAVGVSVATVQGSQSIGFAIPVAKVRQALSGLGI